ncbi:hypothetical protein [Kitasatospora sp. GP82]|uniref:hypothetical protein n=1 Tax=Kitasatospora sp. GP82 TaxID=3035089 RepID=UPI0024755909|nr:hypothetical protein [Kitasatospora sp. GP82]MDH6123722.1 hypothetical protein [Kitasatospora sp. GP82]
MAALTYAFSTLCAALPSACATPRRWAVAAAAGLAVPLLLACPAAAVGGAAPSLGRAQHLQSGPELSGRVLPRPAASGTVPSAQTASAAPAAPLGSDAAETPSVGAPTPGPGTSASPTASASPAAPAAPAATAAAAPSGTPSAPPSAGADGSTAPAAAVGTAEPDTVRWRAGRGRGHGHRPPWALPDRNHSTPVPRESAPAQQPGAASEPDATDPNTEAVLGGGADGRSSLQAQGTGELAAPIRWTDAANLQLPLGTGLSLIGSGLALVGLRLRGR